MSEPKASRLTGEDRREQILAAASVVFGERGYAGGTTDAVAREAGISQAYVVRMFRGKENLFRETAQRASQRVQDAFHEEIAQFAPDESMDSKRHRLGTAYANIVADRGQLLTLLHLFSLGHDENFAPLARECFLSVYGIVRDEAGMSAEEATNFFAQGMLMTVLLAMRMPDAVGLPVADELMACAFGDKHADIVALSHEQLPLDGAGR